jgi:transposase
MISNEIKKAAVLHYNKSFKKSLEKTSKLFNISNKTLRNWLKNPEKRDESLPKVPRNRKPYKFDSRHISHIKDERVCHKYAHLTTTQLTNDINKCFSKKISRAKVLDILREQGWLVKQVKKRSVPETYYNKPRDVALDLKNFYKKVQGHPLSGVICVGDISLRFYHRQKTSNKVVVKYTGFFAIDKSGVLKHTIYKTGGASKARLLEFLSELLENKGGRLIILSNAPSCKSPEIRTCIESTKNKLLYSVPHQSQTQAIVGFFARLKAKMCGIENLSYDLLCDFVKETLTRLPRSLCAGLILSAYEKRYDR